MKNSTLLMIITLIVVLLFIFKRVLNRFFMFDILIYYILKHEGGYVNDPDDLGGETKFGITKRRYPNLDIKNLTKKQAIDIYKKDFYTPMQVDKITDVNLALQYFDHGVNAGIERAKKLLSESEMISKSTGEKQSEVFKRLRQGYYKEVAQLRNNQKYLKGWLKRTDENIIV